MAWTIDYTDTALKELRKLDKQSARIICDIQDRHLRVLVLRIGHRREVYR